jgi:hypothetical protein
VIPQLRAWHKRYEQGGLTIIGVHTPEFFWEKSYTRVVDAAKKFGIQYLLVDKKGIIRYRHIGEGAYAEIEATIQHLLAEAG